MADEAPPDHPAAAALLFAREAFAGVQMDEIARQAGLGKPTLYRYFPSKEDLRLAVCEDAFLRLQSKLEEGHGCPPIEELTRIIAVLAERPDEQMTALNVFEQAAAPGPDRRRAPFRRHKQSIGSALRAMLAAGAERSKFHNFDIRIAPGLVLGTIRGDLAGNPGVPRKRPIEEMTRVYCEWPGCRARSEIQAVS